MSSDEDLADSQLDTIAAAHEPFVISWTTVVYSQLGFHRIQR